MRSTCASWSCEGGFSGGWGSEEPAAAFRLGFGYEHLRREAGGAGAARADDGRGAGPAGGGAGPADGLADSGGSARGLLRVQQEPGQAGAGFAGGSRRHGGRQDADPVGDGGVAGAKSREEGIGSREQRSMGGERPSRLNAPGKTEVRYAERARP